MSIHKSLKMKGKLKRHRNVLTRTERMEALKKEERWEDGDSVFGLQKVRVYKARRKKAVKKEAEAVPGEAVPGEAAVGETAAGEAAAPEAKAPTE